MSAPPTVGLSWQRRLLLASVATLLVLALVPLWPWRPTCRCHTAPEGDLRDIHVDAVTAFMRQEHVYHWRFGDLILIHVLPWFDQTRIMTRSDIIHNMECKLAASFSEDQIVDGALYPAPTAVKRLKVELEPVMGPDQRIKPDGTRIVGLDTRVRRSCRLFRASILEPPALERQ